MFAYEHRTVIHPILICLIGKFSFLIERLWHPPHVSHSWWHFSLILLPKIRVWRIKLCLKQNLRLLCEYCCQKVIDNFGLRSKRIEKEGQHLNMPFDKNTFNTFEYPATFDPACANWVWSAKWEGWMGAWRQGGEPCLSNNNILFPTDNWTLYRAESSQESLLGKGSTHYVHETDKNWFSEKEEWMMKRDNWQCDVTHTEKGNWAQDTAAMDRMQL